MGGWKGEGNGAVSGWVRRYRNARPFFGVPDVLIGSLRSLLFNVEEIGYNKPCYKKNGINFHGFEEAPRNTDKRNHQFLK